MTVNSDFPLLHGEAHNLHHVQDCSEGGHTIVIPSKVVKINCDIKVMSLGHQISVNPKEPMLPCEGRRTSEIGLRLLERNH